MELPPPTTGHRNLPPVYDEGGRTLPLLPPPPADGRDVVLLFWRGAAGFDVGFGIALPFAPGTTRTWPTTRLGSSRPFVARMSSLLKAYFAARASRVSVGGTVTMRPVTGGIRSGRPALTSFDLRSFAHQTDIIETPNFEAMAASVSPLATLYSRTRPLPSGTVVSTATGLTKVPSSMNGPSTSTGCSCLAPSPRSTAAKSSSALRVGSGDPNSTAPTSPASPAGSVPSPPPSTPPTARRGSAPAPFVLPVAAAVWPPDTLTTEATTRTPATAAATARSWPRRQRSGRLASLEGRSSTIVVSRTGTRREATTTEWIPRCT